jgi:hypothetical protein
VVIGVEMMTAEQAAEAAKGLTFEKVWAALMESRQRMEKSTVDMNERMEKSTADMKKSIADTNKVVADTNKRMEKSIAGLSKNIGGLGNTFGRFTEVMFSAGVLAKFGELGFKFNMQANQKKFYEGIRVFAEVDSVLENSEYVMLVEIKTELSIDDIKEHLTRITKVRKYMDALGDGRKIVGTVAGGIIPKRVLAYAQKRGLYALIQTGDAVAIADMPQDFKAQEW